MRGETLNEILDALGGERRIHYALDRFLAALGAVGNPQKDVHSLVIAGTNGKGTTTLLVSSALVRAGHRVGTYLSPHLQQPTERFLNNLRPEGEPALSRLAVELRPVAEQHQLTYFEFLTLLCFVWAKRAGFDYLVLEVGLGGRLDATNVTEPLACAITTIDCDHQEYLGNSREEILDEKMGVLRPESLVFTGVEAPELVARIEAKCQQLDGIAYYASQIRTEVESIDWHGQRVRFNGYPFRLRNPSVGTVQNAAIAFLMMRIVFPKIPVSVLQEAFAVVSNPARMEVVAESPRVVLSGDHNPAGIQCLLETLDRLQVSRDRLHIVCGFSPDKPYTEMYRALRERSRTILLTQIARLRDRRPADYASMGEFEPDAKTAVRKTIALAEPGDTVLVTGSLYLAGEVGPLWRPEVGFLASDP